MSLNPLSLLIAAWMLCACGASKPQPVPSIKASLDQYLAARQPSIHRLWFHGEGDAWVPADRVGFVTTAVTPMGSGLLAVDGRTPGARSLDEVRR